MDASFEKNTIINVIMANVSQVRSWTILEIQAWQGSCDYQK